jgi:hypothetical protein
MAGYVGAAPLVELVAAIETAAANGREAEARALLGALSETWASTVADLRARMDGDTIA